MDIEINMSPIYECPACHSRDVRIDAVLYLIYKPNDPDDTLDHLEPMESEVTWEDDSYARCENCRWEGTAGRLVIIETDTTPQKEESPCST